MLIDASTLAFSTFFIVISTVCSLHLYANFAVLVASQTILIQVASAIDINMLNQQINPLLSLLAALAASMALGIAHIFLLKKFDRHLLLLITVILNIAFKEFWLAYPEVTGGSGGLLLNNKTGYLLPVMAGTLTFFVFLSYLITINRPANKTTWPIVQKLGFRAAIMGINVPGYVVKSFILFALCHGFIGVISVRYFELLSLESFNFNWTLVVLSIVVFSKRAGYLYAVIVSVLFAVIKLVLKSSPNVSLQIANLFELILPSLLIILSLLNQKSYDSTYSTNEKYFFK